MRRGVGYANGKTITISNLGGTAGVDVLVSVGVSLGVVGSKVYGVGCSGMVVVYGLMICSNFFIFDLVCISAAVCGLDVSARTGGAGVDVLVSVVCGLDVSARTGGGRVRVGLGKILSRTKSGNGNGCYTVINDNLEAVAVEMT
nr:hypothetical protein [Tanacetum cinerariifolium]